MFKLMPAAREARPLLSDRAANAFDHDRVESDQDLLEEVAPMSRLHSLDLIGAESVFFFDTWAL